MEREGGGTIYLMELDFYLVYERPSKECGSLGDFCTQNPTEEYLTGSFAISSFSGGASGRALGGCKVVSWQFSVRSKLNTR